LEEYKNISLHTLYKQLAPERIKTTIEQLELAPGTITKSQPAISGTVLKFYKSLYSPTPTDHNLQKFFLDNDLPTLEPQQITSIEKTITTHELSSIIKTSKTGKTPGPDGLSIEIYATFFPHLQEHLLAALSYVYTTGIVNSNFVNGTITLIFKKGNLHCIENYRPISLLNTDYKILNKLLNERIKPFPQKHNIPLQHAQPQQSTHTATISLRDTYHEAQKSDIDTFFIALDFKKAFDSVNYNWLKEVIKCLKFSPIFITYLHQIQHNSFSTIQINKSLTDPFPIRKGVRQGNPLSLTLFIIALNPLILAIQNNRHIYSSPKPVRNAPKLIAYADDITLATSKSKSVREAISILDKFRKASGLQLNKNKTIGLTTNKSLNTKDIWDIQYYGTEKKLTLST